MRSLIALLFVLFTITSAEATDVYITESTTLDYARHDDDILYVSGKHTVLTVVEGGWAHYIWVEEEAHLDLQGGEIDDLYIRTEGTANIYGGSIIVAELFDTATLSCYGGSNGGIFLNGGKFHQHGGSSTFGIWAEGDSRVTIRGGTLNPNIGINAYDDAHVEIIGWGFTETWTSEIRCLLTGWLEDGTWLDDVEIEVRDDSHFETTTVPE